MDDTFEIDEQEYKRQYLQLEKEKTQTSRLSLHNLALNTAKANISK